MICEALLVEPCGDGRRLVYRRCRKHATGKVGGISLCTAHIGSLYVYGAIDATDDEPGFVRRLTIKTDVERIGE